MTVFPDVAGAQALGPATRRMPWATARQVAGDAATRVVLARGQEHAPGQAVAGLVGRHQQRGDAARQAIARGLAQDVSRR